MPISEDQIIMDVPFHLAVPKAGFHFETNTMPNDYTWDQCVLQVCNVIDTPPCLDNYTPDPPFSPSKFTLGYKTADYTLEFHEYENYSEPDTTIVGTLGPLQECTPASNDYLLYVVDPTVVRGFRYDANPDFFPCDGYITPKTADYPRGQGADLNGTYNGTVDSTTKFKPAGPYFFPPCDCYQLHSYGTEVEITYGTQGSIPGFDYAETPATHEFVIRRYKLPVTYDVFDSWVYEGTFPGTGGDPQSTYLFWNSNLGSGGCEWVDQQDWMNITYADDSHLIGKYWDKDLDDTDPNWVPLETFMTPHIDDVRFEDHSTDPVTISHQRRSTHSFITGHRWQKHIQKGYSWEFCEGNLKANFYGSHYEEFISTGGFRIRRVEYAGIDTEEMMVPKQDYTQSYVGSTRTSRNYSSADPDWLNGCLRLYYNWSIYGGGPPFDHPDRAGALNPIGDGLYDDPWVHYIARPNPNWQKFCDIRVKIYYESFNKYLYQVAPHTFQEYGNGQNILGEDIDGNSPPWIQAAGSVVGYIGQTPYVVQSVNGVQAEHKIANVTPPYKGWEDDLYALKLVQPATDYYTAANSTSAQKYPLAYWPQEPEEATYDNFVITTGPDYIHSIGGFYTVDDPKPFYAYAEDSRSIGITITQTGTAEWVRLYNT